MRRDCVPAPSPWDQAVLDFSSRQEAAARDSSPPRRKNPRYMGALEGLWGEVEPILRKAEAVMASIPASFHSVLETPVVW